MRARGGWVTGSIPVIKKGDADVVSTPPSRVIDLRVGDLVRVCECELIYDDADYDMLWSDSSMTCCCSFCENDSSRIGVVNDKPGPGHWNAMFDFGTWLISTYNLEKGHIEVIS